jgi:hypothetical protein
MAAQKHSLKMVYTSLMSLAMHRISQMRRMTVLGSQERNRRRSRSSQQRNLLV